MIHTKAIRQLREARIREAMQHGTDIDGYRRGSLQFLREWHDTLGVTLNESGRSTIPLDERGLPRPSQANCARPGEVSIRALAEAIHGHDFVEEFYHPAGNGFDFGSRQLLEAAIDPTSFLNINVFNLGVAGLVNAKIMERFNAPEYIGRNLVEITPTNQNGHKRIAAAKITPPDKAARGRMPGETHTEVGFGEMYQTTPVTVEQAEKCVVTKEAVYFDLTGEVLTTAGEVGDDLAYGQDRDIAATVLGVTGQASKYNFNGTSYETYQASSPWINTQANALLAGSFDYTNIDKARQLFLAMTDPVTGREIRVNGKDILVNPYNELLMRQQLYGSNIQVGTQLNSNFPSWYQFGPSQLANVGQNSTGTGAMYNVIPMSPIWYNILTASTSAAYPGLGLSAVNAKKYWYVGDFQRAFEWQENWPLTPWQASADELTMKDRGLVAVYGCNYRGSMFVKEPRYAVQNTN